MVRNPKLIPIPVKANLASLYSGLDAILRPRETRANNPRFCPFCGMDGRLYDGHRWICPSLMCTTIYSYIQHKWPI